MKLSIIIPAYNEAPNLGPLYERLRRVWEEEPADWELLLVDDGSTDGTYEEALRLNARDPRVQAISFSRNFGHQMALTAGLDLADGDAVIVMDADLQHPPELITDFVKRWKEGYDIVYTVRASTEDASWSKRITSALFYRIFKRLSGFAINVNAADFRLLDRKVVLSFRGIRERVRFLRGLTSWVGYRSTAVPYHAGKRQSGQSKYSLRRMVSFAVDGLTSFSAAPLHMAVYLGFGLAVVGFLYSAYALYARFLSHTAISGWTSLIMVSLIIGGVQLIVLGIIGIYIGKLYDEVKQRPLYLVQKSTSSLKTKIHEPKLAY